MIDIAKDEKLIATINSILNNNGSMDGIAEIKNEGKRGEIKLVVVQINRAVKTSAKQ